MYKKLSKNFMLNFVDSFFKQFSVQISQFVDTFRIFPTISVNTGNFDVASTDFWLDYGKDEVWNGRDFFAPESWSEFIVGFIRCKIRNLMIL